MALCKKKLAARKIHTTVKMHGQFVTQSTCHMILGVPYHIAKSQIIESQIAKSHSVRH